MLRRLLLQRLHLQAAEDHEPHRHQDQEQVEDQPANETELNDAKETNDDDAPPPIQTQEELNIKYKLVCELLRTKTFRPHSPEPT